MSKVSVIIPCYNSEEYIDKCIDSFEQQTFKDFELIFIDDCSSDNTVTRIENRITTSGLSIRVLQNTENSGPAISRNKGTAAACGEFIAFCDSDDWYDPEYLRLMTDVQRSQKSDLVFCGYKLVLSNGKHINHVYNSSKEELSDEEALILGIDTLCTLIVRREIIRKLPLPNIRNGEDMAIVPLLIANSQTVSLLNKPLYNYYCRSGSASLSPSQETIESLKKSFEHINSLMPTKYNLITEYIGIKNLLYGGILNLFKISFNRNEALRIIGLFEKEYPNWRNNKYLHHLPISKRIFIKCISKGYFRSAYILTKVHSIITK